MDALLNHILARGRKQPRPTAFIDGILEEGFYGLDANLPLRAIRVDGLLLLICAYATRMGGVDPWAHLLVALEAGLIILHPSDKGTDGENLSQLGAAVQVRGTDVLVDFFERCKRGWRGTSAVQVRGHQYQAGSLGALENWEEHAQQMELRKVVDLEMGVYRSKARHA